MSVLCFVAGVCVGATLGLLMAAALMASGHIRDHEDCP